MRARTILLILAICIAANLRAQGPLSSPSDFLPHPLGEQFTPHHLLVDYFQYVAANSDRVQLMEYGRTNEQRPLLLAVVSTPQNLARLDEIRLDHLRRTGREEGRPASETGPAIVWLSFGVHGNEAGASESSMSVLYALTDPADAEVTGWLQNAVVIIDPSINPDGYDRYTHWYRSVSNAEPDPDRTAREHREPWPGGRVNHYYFDLNRDWAWATQVETRQRLKQYHRWAPHIHVDFHEQFPNDYYYFAPAAEPYHAYITDWQRDFQTQIGRNNARYFDEQGWLYYTREVFDLFYPSYGDTYPTFNGAIGMTYEQAGHGISGRAIEQETGNILTLAERIEHHTTTALSTIEISAKNAARLSQEFSKYYRDAAEKPTGPYRSYVISHRNSPDKLKALCELLDRHQIRYGRLGKSLNANAYVYREGKEQNVELAASDLLVSARQPQGVLVQVLFDPDAELVDSLTYDITAWSLPYARGLEAYALKTSQEPSGDYDFPAYSSSLPEADLPYAYLAPWESLADARFLGALLQADLKVRFATSAFTLGGKEYAPGTLILTREDNRNHGSFDETVRELSLTHERPVAAASTGFAEAGRDIGSSSMRYLEAPRIAVLSDEGTSENSAGEIWYYFEQVLHYPVTLAPADRLGQMDLSAYNLLILPEGRYPLNDATLRSLQEWMRNGGRVIAVGAAVSAFQDKDGFQLKKKSGDAEKPSTDTLAKYGDRERAGISDYSPGAILELQMDVTHPLAFGLSERYFSLKLNNQTYAYLDNGWNVGTIPADPITQGFIGANLQKKLPKTLAVGVESKGRGDIVYLVDNPLFRGFWTEGQLLFANAVFLK